MVDVRARTTIAMLLVLLASAHCRRKPEATPHDVTSRPAPPGPWAHDEAEAEQREPRRPLLVRLDGRKPVELAPATIAAVPPARLKAKKGELRQGWWIDDVLAADLQVDARLIAVTGDSGRIAVDGSKRLLLRVMRDGRYKVVDETFATVMRDVTLLDVAQR